jgi:DNA replication protein DnaC
MRPSLLQTLKQLRLSGLAASLEVRLNEAAGNHLDHAEFLELLLQDELNVRSSRLITRRVKAACFGEVKNLDEFDFSFNPSIKRKQIHDLAGAQFIRDKTDVLLLGPPGVGKTFLVQAIGHQAIKAGFLVLYRSIFDLARDFLSEESPLQQDRTLSRYLKPDLLILDDMGMKQLPRRSGEYLLEIIMRRHENRSTMMTSNRPLEDWAKLIGDAPAATAILDRFLQHATIINITGKSYRLRHGGSTEAKANSKGRRSTADDGGCSPPEDTEALTPVSSGAGASANSTV